MGLTPVLLSTSLLAQAATQTWDHAPSTDEVDRIALILGLDGAIAPGRDALTGAENSARLLAETLHEAGFRRVTLLTGPEVSEE